MQNPLSFARPYALAAFEYARETNQLEEWKAFLVAASLTAKNTIVSRMIATPNTSTETIIQLFFEVLDSVLDAPKKNFLKLVIENKRTVLLPEMAELYKNYDAAFEKASTVDLTTAIDIDQAFRDKLAQALSKRVERKVTLRCNVDPSLIGGAIIKIGDWVIDDSIRKKLARMRQDLAS